MWTLMCLVITVKWVMCHFQMYCKWTVKILTLDLKCTSDLCHQQRQQFTWMVRTILLVSSRAAIAVDVPKEAVPR